MHTKSRAAHRTAELRCHPASCELDKQKHSTRVIVKGIKYTKNLEDWVDSAATLASLTNSLEGGAVWVPHGSRCHLVVGGLVPCMPTHLSNLVFHLHEYRVKDSIHLPLARSTTWEVSNRLLSQCCCCCCYHIHYTVPVHSVCPHETQRKHPHPHPQPLTLTLTFTPTLATHTHSRSHPQPPSHTWSRPVALIQHTRKHE